jgi:fibronectin type 3 domain-containing protein
MQFGNLFRARNGWKCIVYCTFAVICFAQNDRGPSGGAAGSGTPIPGLQLGEQNFSYHPRTATVAAQTAPSINYIQGNYATPQTPQTAVNVAFAAAQAAGDLNVVVVGWKDSTAVVNTVTDKSGNTYTRAVGPTVLSGSLSQSIYYAKNIAPAAAGTNIVAVAFSVAATSPDIRILEYSGADLNNPVDVTAPHRGTRASSSSGFATTTNPTDLILGANVVATYTNGPGKGYTSRIITSPDGDIAEDRMVTATGSYSATAPLGSAGPWIMQMVAFRVAAGDTTPPTAPTNLIATTASASQINLSWSGSSDNVGVTAYLVERCQGAGCTAFSQIAALATTTYVDTGLAAGNYSYRVRATDAVGNLSSYSNVASATIAPAAPPVITSATTASGTLGSAFSYRITATNAPTSYEAMGLPAGLSVNTGTGLISGTPTSAGTSTVTLSASNNGGTGNATLTLTFVSTVQLSITPSSTNFGNVPLGSSSIQPVVLNNTNTSSITISQANVAGREFSISGLFLPLTLAAGQNSTFGIAFTPSSAGTVTGSLSLVSNATSSPTSEALFGTGTHNVDLLWQVSTSTVAGYNVYRGSVSGGPYTKLNSSLISGTTYMDTTVGAGQTYYYVATAVDSNNNESTYSNQASAVVPSP